MDGTKGRISRVELSGETETTEPLLVVARRVRDRLFRSAYQAPRMGVTYLEVVLLLNISAASAIFLVACGTAGTHACCVFSPCSNFHV